MPSPTRCSLGFMCRNFVVHIPFGVGQPIVCYCSLHIDHLWIPDCCSGESKEFLKQSTLSLPLVFSKNIKVKPYVYTVYNTWKYTGLGRIKLEPKQKAFYLRTSFHRVWSCSKCQRWKTIFLPNCNTCDNPYHRLSWKDIHKGAISSTFILVITNKCLIELN